jgi:drug/metabolite transporter (DMT)-like permease
MRFRGLRRKGQARMPFAMAHASPQHHRNGLILVTLAALSWSSAGIFTRLISADLMTMLFYRGLFSGAAVFIVHCLLEKRFAITDFTRMGLPGVGVMCLSSMSMISGIGALRYTSVADAMVIYATVPFVTAILAYLFIGERTTRATIFASIVALAGVIIMLLGSQWGGSMLGKGLAVFMTLGMCGFSIIMRGNRDIPMLPAMAASAWLTSLVCFWFAAPMGITQQDFVLCGLFGVLQNAAGLAFYTLGTKRVPAAEATLLAALEVPFTPLWVWLFLNETPPTYTLIGGAVVLVALFTHIFGEFRRAGTKTEAEFVPTP